MPRLARGGRLVYAGAGTSGRIGVQDGAELPPTFDWPPERLVLLIAGGEAALTRAIENAEDDAAAAVAAIERHAIGGDDVVIGLAASGATPFTVAALREAGRRGALTIGVANAVAAPLLDAAAHAIAVETGAEAVAGSTRLQAGTAQKVVLNLFSTLVMIRLGRVYQGLMVDMRATNEKLRRRAVRMLCHLSGRDEATVQDALARAKGKVKLARLVLEGVEPAAAQSLLERNGGSLRAALVELRAMIAIAASRLFDGVALSRDRVVVIDGERIAGVGAAAGTAPEPLPADAILAPGFIDLQVNGGGGVLLNNRIASDAMRDIAAAHARMGTTSILPTLISGSRADIAAALDAAMPSMPGVAGLHIEGPFIAPARHGIHPVAAIRPMEDADFALRRRRGFFPA